MCECPINECKKYNDLLFRVNILTRQIDFLLNENKILKESLRKYLHQNDIDISNLERQLDLVKDFIFDLKELIKETEVNLK